MESKFNLDDIVEFEGEIYKVKGIHFLNPQVISDPYVCRIVKLSDDWNMLATALLVREGLLKKLNTKSVKVLYGT